MEGVELESGNPSSDGESSALAKPECLLKHDPKWDKLDVHTATTIDFSTMLIDIVENAAMFYFGKKRELKISVSNSTTITQDGRSELAEVGRNVIAEITRLLRETFDRMRPVFYKQWCSTKSPTRMEFFADITASLLSHLMNCFESETDLFKSHEDAMKIFGTLNYMIPSPLQNPSVWKSVALGDITKKNNTLIKALVVSLGLIESSDFWLYMLDRTDDISTLDWILSEVLSLELKSKVRDCVVWDKVYTKFYDTDPVGVLNILQRVQPSPLKYVQNFGAFFSCKLPFKTLSLLCDEVLSVWDVEDEQVTMELMVALVDYCSLRPSLAGFSNREHAVALTKVVTTFYDKLVKPFPTMRLKWTYDNFSVAHNEVKDVNRKIPLASFFLQTEEKNASLLNKIWIDSELCSGTLLNNIFELKSQPNIVIEILKLCDSSLKTKEDFLARFGKRESDTVLSSFDLVIQNCMTTDKDVFLWVLKLLTVSAVMGRSYDVFKWFYPNTSRGEFILAVGKHMQTEKLKSCRVAIENYLVNDEESGIYIFKTGCKGQMPKNLDFLFDSLKCNHLYHDAFPDTYKEAKDIQVDTPAFRCSLLRSVHDNDTGTFATLCGMKYGKAKSRNKKKSKHTKDNEENRNMKPTTVHPKKRKLK